MRFLKECLRNALRSMGQYISFYLCILVKMCCSHDGNWFGISANPTATFCVQFVDSFVVFVNPFKYS